MDTEKQFTGQRLDATTGLYYYGARYYDPLIGRFISADVSVQLVAGVRTLSAGLNVSGHASFPTFNQAPVDPQALNRYSYALNNPLRYVDPSGEQTLAIGIGGTGGLGGGGSGALMIVVSRRGGVGFVWSGGGGGYAGMGGGVGVVFQFTTAKRVEQLRGPSMQSGGSYSWCNPFTPVCLSAGLEHVAGKGYQGVQVTFGPSVGPAPIEEHGILENAGVKVLRSESNETHSGDISGRITSQFGGSASSAGFAAERGAGIIGDISMNLGLSGLGTDEAGNVVALVSIEGGDPTWVTVESANSMLKEGEDVVYVRP